MNFYSLYQKYLQVTPLQAPTLETFSSVVTDLLCYPPQEQDRWFNLFTSEELEWLDNHFRALYTP